MTETLSNWLKATFDLTAFDLPTINAELHKFIRWTRPRPLPVELTSPFE